MLPQLPATLPVPVAARPAHAAGVHPPVRRAARPALRAARRRGHRRQPAAARHRPPGPRRPPPGRPAPARRGHRPASTRAPPENFCRPAVDLLFRSAVAAYGGAVLAAGPDRHGLRRPQRRRRDPRPRAAPCSSQDEATSVVWGMPGAVGQAGFADEVLPLDRVAEAILRAPRRSGPPAAPAPRSPEAPDDPHRRPASTGSARWCTRRARSCWQPGKEYLVEARLLPLARQAGAAPTSARSSSPCATARTRRAPAASSRRSPPTRPRGSATATRSPRSTSTVLPALVRGPRPDERLQIWSAACSSGQEPYTIAMLLEDALPERGSRVVDHRDRPLPRDGRARPGPAGSASSRSTAACPPRCWSGTSRGPAASGRSPPTLRRHGDRQRVQPGRAAAADGPVRRGLPAQRAHLLRPADQAVDPPPRARRSCARTAGSSSVPRRPRSVSTTPGSGSSSAAAPPTAR